MILCILITTATWLDDLIIPWMSRVSCGPIQGQNVVLVEFTLWITNSNFQFGYSPKTYRVEHWSVYRMLQLQVPTQIKKCWRAYNLPTANAKAIIFWEHSQKVALHTNLNWKAFPIMENYGLVPEELPEELLVDIPNLLTEGKQKPLLCQNVYIFCLIQTALWVN